MLSSQEGSNTSYHDTSPRYDLYTLSTKHSCLLIKSDQNRSNMNCLLVVFIFLSALCAGFPNNVSISRHQATGLQANPSHSTGLSRRQCELYSSDWDCDQWLPSLKDFVVRLTDSDDGGRANPDHHLAFYTGLDVDKIETAILIDRWFRSQYDHAGNHVPLPYCTFFNCLNTDWFLRQQQYIREHDFLRTAPEYWGEDPENDFEVCYSQALAYASTNADVILFTPRGREPKPHSVWTRYEYWVLTQRPSTQRIWRVDPRDPRELGVPQEQWCEWHKPVLFSERGNEETDHQGNVLEAVDHCTVKYWFDDAGDETIWTSWGPAKPMGEPPSS